MKIIILLIMFFSFLSCGIEERQIFISNNSANPVYVYMSLGTHTRDFTTYPDTMLPPSDSVFMGNRFS